MSVDPVSKYLPMSIPLDDLYHYIENVAKEIDKGVIIYRFWPHGSKNIANLENLKGSLTWSEHALGLNITCHDQEPLNYKLWQPNKNDSHFTNLLKSCSLVDYTQHNLIKITTAYGKICLLHSEKRSNHVEQYQNNCCVTVYYWSHALISLDWFRFAQHVQQTKQVQHTFLIYNRAWSGTREYRLKFSELLIKLGLHNSCQTTINPIETELGIHYSTYQFKNSAWRPEIILEDYFPASTATSNYSATFNINDYQVTDIEVVLETLFDDSRLHLTEKSLRPIACGQPFILVGTHGSLEYLRSYGFKTFGDIWDEHYDLIEDPQLRMYAITDLMYTITNWLPEIREQKMAQARAVTDYNRQYFFSKEFFSKITGELKNNLNKGIGEIQSNVDFQPFIDRWETRLTFKEIKEFLENPEPGPNSLPTIDQVNQTLNKLRRRNS